MAKTSIPTDRLLFDLIGYLIGRHSDLKPTFTWRLDLKPNLIIGECEHDRCMIWLGTSDGKIRTNDIFICKKCGPANLADLACIVELAASGRSPMAEEVSC